MKLLKSIFWFLFVSIGLGVSILLMLAYYFEDNINQLLAKELNDRLQVPVKVKNTELSLLHHFPKASIRFEEVISMDSHGKDTLFAVEDLHISFNLLDLFGSQIDISSIYLYRGKLNLSFDRNGLGNYFIWKPSETQAQTALNLNLERIELDQIDFNLKDLKNKVSMTANIDEWVVQGKLNAGGQSFSNTGTALIQSLKSSAYTLPLPTDLNIQTAIHLNQGEWTIDPSQCKINNQQIITSLSMTEEEGFIVEFSGKNWLITEALKLVPKEQLSLSLGASLEGRLNFQGKYASQNQSFASDFDLSEGLFKSPNKPNLSKITGSGSYRSKKGWDVLSLENCSALIGQSQVKGGMKLTNSKHPVLEFQLQSQGNVKDFMPFLAFPTVQKAEAEILLDVNFKGRFKSLKKPTKTELRNATLSGSLGVKNGSMVVENQAQVFENINGKIDLHSQLTKIHFLKGQAGQSDFHLEGAVANVIPYTLIETEPIAGSLSLKSYQLNLDELLQSQAANKHSNYHLSLSPRIKLDMQLEIDQFKFRDFQAQALKGKVRMNNRFFQVESIAFKGMKGDFNGQFSINNQSSNTLSLAGYLNLNKVDIHQLFKACENFNQSVIGHQNLHGRVTGKIQLSGDWSESLEPRLSSIKSNASISITSGELINYEPLLALSEYISEDALKHIRFENLSNEIVIENQKIIVPQMDIRSSAIDLSGSGTHGFDNSLDYRLQIVLADLLFKKKSREEVSPDIVVLPDGTEKRKLHMYVKGTVDDPIVGIDNKAAAKKLVDDIKKEGQTLKEILKKEFEGKNPTPKDSSKHKPKNSGIVIEWDDD